MIHKEVALACEAFVREYDAPNIVKELEAQESQGNFTTSALIFTSAFPNGVEIYSRKDLIPELYWYVRGYLQDSVFPGMGVFDKIKSAFSSAPVIELVRAHEAYQKGLAEKKIALAEIGKAQTDLEATLEKRPACNFTSISSLSSRLQKQG